MSGGEYDWIYLKIQEFAESIHEKGDGSAANPELRRRFKAHLLKVAKAAKAIEWNDSGDGDDEETRLIEACLGQRG